MKNIKLILLLPSLLMPVGFAHAATSFGVSPSIGIATIQNIDGYKDSGFLRLDGNYYPIKQLGLSVFGTQYQDFESSRNASNVDIELNGFGVGVTGRWPVHKHVQPYIRAEYFRWNAEASGLGRTLGKDNGGSAGLAIGMQFPIYRIFGIKAEASGYNNVSGADIRQLSVGVTLEF